MAKGIQNLFTGVGVITSALACLSIGAWGQAMIHQKHEDEERFQKLKEDREDQRIKDIVERAEKNARKMVEEGMPDMIKKATREACKMKDSDGKGCEDSTRTCDGNCDGKCTVESKSSDLFAAFKRE